MVIILSNLLRLGFCDVNNLVAVKLLAKEFVLGTLPPNSNVKSAGETTGTRDLSSLYLRVTSAVAVPFVKP